VIQLWWWSAARQRKGWPRARRLLVVVTRGPPPEHETTLSKDCRENLYRFTDDLANEETSTHHTIHQLTHLSPPNRTEPPPPPHHRRHPRDKNPSALRNHTPEFCRAKIRRSQWEDVRGCFDYRGDGWEEAGGVCHVSSIPEPRFCEGGGGRSGN